jgi:lysosomal acid lipase/cholesteryl ester hydrolase
MALSAALKVYDQKHFSILSGLGRHFSRSTLTEMKLHLRVFALLLLSLALLVSVNALKEEAEVVPIDADAGLNVKQIIQKRGYAVEEHKVTTSDRYVLTMYRLPKSYDETQRNVSAAPNKPAVYLIHGLLDSSYAYVLNFRAQSLAYILADAGYDVWLGNNRGTTWSREHLDFNPDKDDAYWDFSWDDMGRYDLPAMINYVLNVSKRPTLSYIGHSEGTTQAFVGFTYNQEVAKRVSYFGAMAPVAFLGDSESEIFNLLAHTYVDKFVTAFGVREFLMRSPLINDIVGKFACVFVDVACGTFINALTGPSVNINTTRIHVYITQTPAGTSVKNMGHYAQSIRDDTFRRYDYGCSCSKLLPISLCLSAICKNKAIYGTFEPPTYDLSKMKYPRTHFITGAQDTLATAKDLVKLRSRLPSGTIFSENNVQYGHLDYTWATNANEVIYKDMIAKMKLFEGKEYS